MQCCGIVAEYNPFHNGHALLMDAARAECEHVIVVMSGSFVQRGEPAAYDKWQRTRWALEGGASAVLELPCVFALQSAASFARGAVRTLAAFGIESLYFGSEAPDVQLIQRSAELLSGEAVGEAIKQRLAEGLSYPQALSLALESFDEQAAQAMRSPNFTLGVEYAAAASRYAPHIELRPVQRIGDYGDFEISGSIASASAVRAAFERGDFALSRSAVPEYVELSAPATLEQLQGAIMYSLRSADAEHLCNVAGLDEGLHNVLLREAAKTADLSELLQSVKTKRYTMARIKRALCCLLLGITKEIAASANAAPPPYLRVLGIKKEALPLLKTAGGAPLITQKTDAYALSSHAKTLYSIDCLAADLQALSGNADTRARRDFTEKLIVI